MVAAVRLLVDSLRERGVRQTATRAQQLVAQRRTRRRRAREDHAFDRDRGVDTARWVHVPRLDTRSPNLLHAVRYQPTGVSEFRLLTAKLPPTPSGSSSSTTARAGDAC